MATIAEYNNRGDGPAPICIYIQAQKKKEDGGETYSRHNLIHFSYNEGGANTASVWLKFEFRNLDAKDKKHFMSYGIRKVHD